MFWLRQWRLNDLATCEALKNFSPALERKTLPCRPRRSGNSQASLSSSCRSQLRIHFGRAQWHLCQFLWWPSTEPLQEIRSSLFQTCKIHKHNHQTFSWTLMNNNFMLLWSSCFGFWKGLFTPEMNWQRKLNSFFLQYVYEFISFCQFLSDANRPQCSSCRRKDALPLELCVAIMQRILFLGLENTEIFSRLMCFQIARKASLITEQQSGQVIHSQYPLHSIETKICWRKNKWSQSKLV